MNKIYYSSYKFMSYRFIFLKRNYTNDYICLTLLKKYNIIIKNIKGGYYG